MKNNIGKTRHFGLVLAAFVASAGAQAQEVVLKVSHFLPPTSNYQKTVLEPWCAALNKDSGGKLKCQIYPAMQLGGTPPQLADQVKNGVSDVVWTSPSYTTGRFPATEALELPFSMPTGGLAGARAMTEYCTKYCAKDYGDYQLLAIWSGTNLIINTASKPILALDSFKGIKLRSPSRSASKLITALGGAPVNMPPAQITEAVSKGVVDGAMAPYEVVPAVKLDEVTKYHMDSPAGRAGFIQNPVVMLMNKQKYASLTPELRAVVDKHSGLALAELAGASWDKANEEARKMLIAHGNKVLTIKDEDYDAMRKAAANIEKEWATEVAAKGVDGAKLAAEARAIGAKYIRP
jgi:TRAP-type C4-dicarboxylate transport system substrate-binding protein